MLVLSFTVRVHMPCKFIYLAFSYLCLYWRRASQLTKKCKIRQGNIGWTELESDKNDSYSAGMETYIVYLIH